MNQNSTIIRLLDAIDRNDLVNIYAIGAEVRTAMAGKNGGLNGLMPAFPCPSPLHGHPHPGLTKEEWFAAQAPTDIPIWFSHSMRHDPEPSPFMNPPYMHFEGNELYTKEWDHENDDWFTFVEDQTPEHAITKAEIIDYWERFKEFEAKYAAWKQRDRVEAYFQWRRFYGQQMAAL
jgi:hypothetical protein